MSNKIILKSSDGESFEVDEAVARECLTIKHMNKDECTENGVPLPNVNSATLAKVLEYCKKHVEAAADAGSNENTELNTWDQDFVKVDQAVLFDLLRAANFLNIPRLIDLTSETVADMMKNMNAEEIRKQFHIKNDFTPEEEAEIHKENAWPF